MSTFQNVLSVRSLWSAMVGLCIPHCTTFNYKLIYYERGILKYSLTIFSIRNKQMITIFSSECERKGVNDTKNRLMIIGLTLFVLLFNLFYQGMTHCCTFKQFTDFSRFSFEHLTVV